MQAETIQAPDLERAEARLPRRMIALALVSGVAALISGHARASAGFALGSALAIVNYYWLHSAMTTLFDAGNARLPKRTAVKFALRYPLAFGAVYFFYRTELLPFGAVLGGLFVPVGGALIEAVLQLGKGWRQLRTDNSPLTTGSCNANSGSRQF